MSDDENKIYGDFNWFEVPIDMFFSKIPNKSDSLKVVIEIFEAKTEFQIDNISMISISPHRVGMQKKLLDQLSYIITDGLWECIEEGIIRDIREKTLNKIISEQNKGKENE